MTTPLVSEIDVRRGVRDRPRVMRQLKIALYPILLSTIPLMGCGTGVMAPSWTQLREHTACEAMDPHYCVGSYGFTVESDGRFQVGPAENGVRLTGQLSAPELAQVSADAGALASSGLHGAPECDPGHVIPGTGLSIDMTLEDQSTIAVVSNLCYRGGRDRAIRLRDDLSALMQVYYPRPVPP